MNLKVHPYVIGRIPGLSRNKKNCFRDGRLSYSESDLEEAIINHLQAFLLETGEGFVLKSYKSELHLTLHEGSEAHPICLMK